MSLFRNPEESRIANILLNKGCLATTMFLIFHKEWGEEFLGWESETLDREIEDTFHIRIPSENLDKIEALASALVSDSFYRDWAAFSVICQSLSDHRYNTRLFNSFVYNIWSISTFKIIY